MFKQILDSETLALAKQVDNAIQGKRDKSAFDTMQEILFEYVTGGDPQIWEMMPSAGAQIAADKVQRAWTVQDLLGFINHEKLP